MKTDLVKSRRGIGGHHSAAAETTTWLTPPHILRALGPFDLDPCAAPDPKPWPTATAHYTLPQDGLILPWHGRVWVNPPYGLALTAWLEKAADYGRATALIFARVETNAFFSQVWARADALLFLRGRLHFHYPNGRRADANGGAPNVLIAYGRDDADILRGCGLDGAFVGLKIPILMQVLMTHADDASSANMTWRQIITETLHNLGGSAKLADIYEQLENHPKTANNRNWQAKIRQTVARMRLPKPQPAQYSLAI